MTTFAANPPQSHNLARSLATERLLSYALLALIVALGAYLRWSHAHLTEFGIDQESVLKMGRLIRDGAYYPLHGMRSGVGAAAGPIEYYLMAIPLYFSEAPEFAAAWVGLLSLAAGGLFSFAVWRHFGAFVGAGTLALFATGPWSVYYGRKIWTPDTFPVFTAAVYLLLVLSLAERRRWALPAAMLLLGLEVQLHLSALVLLPTFGAVVLLFWRRIRLAELAAGTLLFLATLIPYGMHNYETGFEDLRMLLAAGQQSAGTDARSLDLLQALVSGAEFPQAIGLFLPPQAATFDYPLVPAVLALGMWGGALLVAWRVIHEARRGRLSPVAVAGLLALIWALLPVAINIRHSVPLYFRYQLFVLPIPFLFPAVFFVRLGEWATGLLARLRAGRALATAPLAVAVPALLLAACSLHGALRVEATHRAMAAPGITYTHGTKDAYSGPPISVSRTALERLETITRPDADTVVVGPAPRGSLEYLSNGRHRLRFIDAADIFVLPGQRSTLVFVPTSRGLVDSALGMGAAGRGDVALFWPPYDQPATVLEVDPSRVALPPGYVPVAGDQKLDNGLQLVAYAVTKDDGEDFELSTIWRVVEETWAHRFGLYNMFIHLSTLAGRQIEVAGETELSTSSNWQTDDLLVIPMHFRTAKPLARALYRADMGVYVRFPPRVPIPRQQGTVEAASLGRVRLGKPHDVPSPATPRATFGTRIVLAAAEARLDSPARAIHLSLVWQTKSKTDVDYTVFAHLYDAENRLIAQKDGWPVEGNYPTSAWEPGEYVHDARTIVLPAQSAGPITLKVGLYDAKTMQRLEPSPSTPDLAVAIATFEVEQR